MRVSYSQQKRALCLIGAAAIATGIPDVAFAQNEGDGTDGNDIIVTAQFREQRLQDTPIAITALGGEEIQNKALNSVADIGATAPNVNINVANGAQAGAAIFIRGIGQYDSSFAFEPGVGVYTDDIYHGVMVGSMFDLLDLDRVEILRGPQGTLAGKNSIGGAVKLFSVKPKGDGSGYVSATGGSFDRLEVRAAYDIGLTDDLAMRISGFSKHRDGHVKILDFACDRPGDVLPGDPPSQKTGDDCQIGTLGGIKASGLRVAFRYTPSDAVEVNLFGSIIRDDSEAAVIEQSSAPDPRYLPNRNYVYYGTFTAPGWDAEELATTHSESIGGSIDISLSDHIKLTSITGYENLDSVNTLDSDGGPAPEQLTYNRAPYHQFTQEVRLGGDFGDGLVDWTVGGYYFDSVGRVASRVYSFPRIDWIQNDPVKNVSKSLFAQVEIHPTENLSVIGGIRYTKDEKSYKFVRLNPETGEPLSGLDDPLGVGALNFIPPPTYEGSSTDYRLGVNYRFSDQLMAYANFSTGYKGGGVNPRPFTAAQAVSFSPERVNAYEVGFKTDFADNMVRLNVAAFLNKYNNIILAKVRCLESVLQTPCLRPDNIGTADVKGFELESTLRPFPGLTIDGSLAYLDFKYTAPQLNGFLISGKDAAGNPVVGAVPANGITPYTPKWTWSTGIQYDHVTDMGTFSARLDGSYQGKLYTNAENTSWGTMKGRFLANGQLSWRDEKGDWKVSVEVKNLLDKYYFLTVSDVTTSLGIVSGVPGLPRTWLVGVTRNF